MVNGKQQTVVWHVDDLKISHVDENVNTDIITRLTVKYGKDAYGNDCPSLYLEENYMIILEWPLTIPLVPNSKSTWLTTS